MRDVTFLAPLAVDDYETRRMRVKIENESFDANFVLAARNIRGFDLLLQEGANVYDILRRDTLVLTKNAVEALEARLK